MKIRLNSKPLIAVTMGDPAGIGGEVTLKALAYLQKKSEARFLLLGDYRHWVRQVKKFKVPIRPVLVNAVELAGGVKKGIAILDLGGVLTIQWGKISAPCGKAAVQYITAGAKLALAGKVDALVTAPIHKEAAHLSGCRFPGHTELLASLSTSKSFAMMMVGGPFKIVLQSIHIPLSEVAGRITPSSVWEKLLLTRESLRGWFRISNPRIAVAGVNPHAGEGGAFGKEEMLILSPVVQKAKRKGWKVTGPHPPDTLFYWALKKKYDAILSMYHDQGLIPLKLLAFDTGVNLTLGLPFVRTSPDHGTAFDIAGKGKANPKSMIAAIQLAEQIIKKQERLVKSR